jgi:hypothetical protein
MFFISVSFIESFELKHQNFFLTVNLITIRRQKKLLLWVLGWIHGSWMVLGRGFDALRFYCSDYSIQPEVC